MYTKEKKGGNGKDAGKRKEKKRGESKQGKIRLSFTLFFSYCFYNEKSRVYLTHVVRYSSSRPKLLFVLVPKRLLSLRKAGIYRKLLPPGRYSSVKVEKWRRGQEREREEKARRVPGSRVNTRCWTLQAALISIFFFFIDFSLSLSLPLYTFLSMVFFSTECNAARREASTC